MSASSRRVVVTGLGAVTPLGHTVATTWDGLVHGRSGVCQIAQCDTAGLDVTIAAEVKGFDPLAHFDRKEARRLDRFTQLGTVAFNEALADSGLAITDANAHRVGVMVGSCMGGMITVFEQARVLLERGADRVSPFLIPMFLSNMLGGHISMTSGARGPNFSPVSACATSADCVGEAAEIIRRGDADVMIAGGSEATISPLILAGFDAMKALSHRNDDPARASRPFDSDRDGFVMGEGAGILILEEGSHARQRGARVHAELAGSGETADAHHITAPRDDGSGAAQAMRLAIGRAGLQPSDIGYVNAHATSTGLGDIAETRAMKAVFGSRVPPISATKSMTGHLLGAAGAVELIIAILAMTEGVLPPTINLDHPDPECDLDYVPNAARDSSVDAVLSNSFGFGGHNAAIVARRYSG